MEARGIYPLIFCEGRIVPISVGKTLFTAITVIQGGGEISDEDEFGACQYYYFYSPVCCAFLKCALKKMVSMHLCVPVKWSFKDNTCHCFFVMSLSDALLW